MSSFSKRMGLKSGSDAPQIEEVSDALRNSLWNVIFLEYFKDLYHPSLLDHELNNNKMYNISVLLWRDYFKKPLDELSDHGIDTKREVKEYFLECPWNEVYDFIEFVANNTRNSWIHRCFVNSCNEVLEKENSAYRFIDDIIVPITDNNEIEEIENAFNILAVVDAHLHAALELLANRESPDYRNSIKESISAVEAICRVICGDENATLGEALKRIDKQRMVKMDTPLKEAFSKLYGWTSSSGGIRHSLLNQPTVTVEDARFMLVACSAFINYLKGKCSKAGVSLLQKSD